MGQMKKLWEQDVENAQCLAEDVIASLIPAVSYTHLTLPTPPYV